MKILNIIEAVSKSITSFFENIFYGPIELFTGLCDFIKESFVRLFSALGSIIFSLIKILLLYAPGLISLFWGITNENS
jgi:hypothetical protein